MAAEIDPRISSGAFNASEDGEEATLRPKLLGEFLGQAQLKRNLRVH